MPMIRTVNKKFFKHLNNLNFWGKIYVKVLNKFNNPRFFKKVENDKDMPEGYGFILKKY